MDSEATTFALYNANINNNIKAVSLYLNTPGDSTYPHPKIAFYVKALAEEKLVIALIGVHCTLGG